jgi:hypothetical protein
MPPLPCKPIRERPRPLCSLRLIISMDRRGQDPGGRKQACASAVANLTIIVAGTPRFHGLFRADRQHGAGLPPRAAAATDADTAAAVKAATRTNAPLVSSAQPPH